MAYSTLIVASLVYAFPDCDPMFCADRQNDAKQSVDDEKYPFSTTFLSHLYSLRSGGSIKIQFLDDGLNRVVIVIITS